MYIYTQLKIESEVDILSVRSKLINILGVTLSAASLSIVSANTVLADPANNQDTTSTDIVVNSNSDNNSANLNNMNNDSDVKTAKDQAQIKRDKVVNQAAKEIGKPYVWGATGPSSFDCSGLTQYTYKHAIGKVLPRTTYTQVNLGTRVSMKNLKKGDLLFWGPKNAPYHVGIYAGNGQYIHAPQPGQNVRKQALSSYFYPSVAKRIIK